MLALLAQTCPLAGRVVDASSSEAIQAVSVTVTSTAGVHSTQTSTQGRFRIDTACGRVQLRLQHPDYETSATAVTAPARLDLTMEPKDVVRIDDVVVVAPSLKPEDTRAASTISGADLERQRGLSLAEAVERVPGVNVLRSGTVAKPIVRGQSGPRVLVLFDGVRHEGQAWGLDHAPEIDPWTAGSLTVVRGAAGVRYGAEALAGVLLVEPPSLREQPGLSANFNTVFALNGRKVGAAARLDGRSAALPEFAWRLEANVSRSAALETPSYPLDNTGAFEFNVGATAAYDESNWGLKLSLHHLNQANGLCLCLSNDSFDDFSGEATRERPRGSEFYDVAYEIERPRQDVNHTRLILRGHYELASQARFVSTYALQLNRREEREVVRSANAGPNYDFTLWTHTLDLSFEHAPVSWGPRELVGSLGVFGIAQENRYTGLPLIPSYTAAGVGLFGLERLKSEDFEIEAGLRYEFKGRSAQLTDNDFAKQKARGQLTDDDCAAGGDSVSCGSSFHTVSASLGGLRRLADGISIKLDLSSAARVPTIDEQYIGGTAPSFPILAIGQPKLSPETSYTVSTSFVVQRQNVHADVSVFASYVDDYINFSPDLNADGTPVFEELVRGRLPRFSYQQVNAALVGADAQAGIRIGPIEPMASVSGVWGRDLSRDAPLAFVPPPRGRLELVGHLPETDVFTEGRVAVTGSYVLRQGHYDARVDLAEPPSAYGLLGASVSGALRLGGQRYVASLEATNLLNHRYRDYTSLLRYFADEPGRQVILRLGAELDLVGQ